MHRTGPKAESALHAVYKIGQVGPQGRNTLRLCEIDAPTVLQVSAFRGKEHEAAARISAIIKATAPTRPGAAITDQGVCVAVGPQRWLLVQEADVVQNVQDVLRDTAAVVDQSAGRTMIRLQGSTARDVLAKGAGVDFELMGRQGGPSVVQTSLAHVAVVLIARGADIVDVVVYRSFAQHLWEWLTDACLEFGYAVVQSPPRREVTQPAA